MFAPTRRSAHGTAIGSGTRAAACLLTEDAPRTAPIAPSDIRFALRQVHSRFDLAPRTGLQLPRSAR